MPFRLVDWFEKLVLYFIVCGVNAGSEKGSIQARQAAVELATSGPATEVAVPQKAQDIMKMLLGSK